MDASAARWFRRPLVAMAATTSLSLALTLGAAAPALASAQPDASEGLAPVAEVVAPDEGGQGQAAPAVVAGVDLTAAAEGEATVAEGEAAAEPAPSATPEPVEAPSTPVEGDVALAAGEGDSEAAEGEAGTPSETVLDGWVTEGDATLFYVDGKLADDIWAVDPKTGLESLFLEGALAEGWATDPRTGVSSLFLGGTLAEGWATDPKTGAAAFFVAGARADGVWATDPKTGSEAFFVDGALADAVWEVNPLTGLTSYFSGGQLASGWVRDSADDDREAFFSAGLLANGLHYDERSGKHLYFVDGQVSTAATGEWRTVDGKRLFFIDGKLADQVWGVDEDGTLRYFVEGAYADRVFVIDEATGDRCWVEDGLMITSHSFYDPATDAWYWADADGVIARGKDAYIPESSDVDWDRWLVDEAYRAANGKWVRFNDDYTMVKGEDYVSEGGHWYYFDLVSGEMAKNFTHITDSAGSGKWVYYDDVFGYMLYGEQYKPNNTADFLSGSNYHWYYFDEYTGATQYGFKTLSEKTVYYDDVMGWMVYLWRYIPNSGYGTNTSWHFFDRYTGALMTADDRGNAAHDSYLRIQGSTSKTPYYLVVDKNNFRTVAFRWGGDNWDVVKVFKCGLGRPEANHGRGTQEGFYYLGENRPDNRPLANSEMWRAQYDRMEYDGTSGVAWRIHYLWDQGFHSTVWTPAYQTPPEQQLERYLSDGCVRLLEQDAKWIWDNCANGTRVYIFRRY